MLHITIHDLLYTIFLDHQNAINSLIPMYLTLFAASKFLCISGILYFIQGRIQGGAKGARAPPAVDGYILVFRPRFIKVGPSKFFRASGAI